MFSVNKPIFIIHPYYFPNNKLNNDSSEKAAVKKASYFIDMVMFTQAVHFNGIVMTDEVTYKAAYNISVYKCRVPAEYVYIDCQFIWFMNEMSSYEL